MDSRCGPRRARNNRWNEIRSGRESNRFFCAWRKQSRNSYDPQRDSFLRLALSAEAPHHAGITDIFILELNIIDSVAERGGLEPPRPFRVYTRSRRAR